MSESILKDKFWTVSNVLSILRILLVGPFIYALVNDQTVWIIIIGLAAILSDWLDGFLARKLGDVSEWGKILDPVADKAFIGGVAIALIVLDRVPMWFVIAVVARDLIILSGGILAGKKLGYVLPSNWTGKVTVVIISAVFIGIVFKVDIAQTWGLYIATAAMIISLIVYAARTINILKNENK